MKRILFWKSLSRTGGHGAAAHDWKLWLGKDWQSAPILRTPAIAEMIVDPTNLQRHLNVRETSDGQFAAYSQERPAHDIPLSLEKVAVWVPDWNKISTELAGTLGFHPTRPGLEGFTRQIGSIHPPKQPVSPVFLFLPTGGIADMIVLMGDLAALPPCTLLLPSRKFITEQVSLLAASKGIILDSILERLEAAQTGSVQVRGMVKKAGNKKVRTPLLDVGPDWAWANLKVTVDPVGRVQFRYGRQHAAHNFRKPQGRAACRNTEILLKIATYGRWKNPPVRNKTNDGLSKAFRRLVQTLRELLPIGGEPFERINKEYRPVFQIELPPEYEAAVRKHLEDLEWE